MYNIIVYLYNINNIMYKIYENNIHYYMNNEIRLILTVRISLFFLSLFLFELLIYHLYHYLSFLLIL